jgi:hypothetical protein
MSSAADERRYSDEEFALILRTASEVRAGPAPAPPQEGLTLSEIREIAAEVGIDPERVSKAAALLPSVDDATIFGLLGGRPRQRLEHSISGVVPTAGLGGVIDVARRVLDSQGETREVLGALEWKGGTSTSSIVVSVTPRQSDTILQASVDRTEAMAGIYGGVGITVAGVITVVLGKLVFGETGAGIVAALLSGFTPSILLARTLWKRMTKRWQERLLHLMDAMAREAEAAAERTDGEVELPPLLEPGSGSSLPGEPDR